MNHLDPATEQAVRRFKALMVGQFDTAGTIVYGSRARGTHRPDSDADVAVLLKGEHQRLLPTALAMSDLALTYCWKRASTSRPYPSGSTIGSTPNAIQTQSCLTTLHVKECNCERFFDRRGSDGQGRNGHRFSQRFAGSG